MGSVIYTNEAIAQARIAVTLFDKRSEELADGLVNLIKTDNMSPDKHDKAVKLITMFSLLVVHHLDGSARNPHIDENNIGSVVYNDTLTDEQAVECRNVIASIIQPDIGEDIGDELSRVSAESLTAVDIFTTFNLLASSVHKEDPTIRDVYDVVQSTQPGSHMDWARDLDEDDIYDEPDLAVKMCQSTASATAHGALRQMSWDEFVSVFDDYYKEHFTKE